MKYGDYEERFKSLVDTYLKDNGLEGLDELGISRFDTDTTTARIEGEILKLDLYFMYKFLLVAEVEWLFVYKKAGSIRRTYTREVKGSFDNLEVVTAPKIKKFYYDNCGVSWAKDHPSLEEEDD